MPDHDVDVAIIGAGTAGMAAYREAIKTTDRVALIDGGKLGTTCARVGCMPSKLLIAAADAPHNALHTDQFGISSGQVIANGATVMDRVRSERDRFVGFVQEAVDGFDKRHLIRQNARFIDDNTLELTDGTRVTARAIIIATGSRPSYPRSFASAGERLIVNDQVFDWRDLPESVAVFGAGVIGLELGQALSRLGVRMRLFGLGNSVGPLTDPDLLAYARKVFGTEFPAHFNADTEVNRDGDAVRVKWADRDDPTDQGVEQFEWLLAATGRRANLDGIGIENTSLQLDERGAPIYDPHSMSAETTTSQTSSIFVAGDATIDLPLLHEAADEGRIAGENAARYPEVYLRARRTSMGVVFTDPQIGIAGRSHRQILDAGLDFAHGDVSFEDQGRARVMGKAKGHLRVYGERETGLLLGAELIGPAAEHLTHLLAWSIESRLTVTEVLERPFYHPVIEEGLRTALRKLAAALQLAQNPPLRCIDCGPGG